MEIHNLEDELSNNQPITDRCGLKVTDLKPAVKNESRVNIFINEKYEFSLDLAQVVDYKVKIGMILTPEKLEELKKVSEFGKLYQRALEWVLLRPHSIKETRDYLVRKLKKREAENRQIKFNREKIKSETETEKAERKIREERFGTRLKTKELPLFSGDDIDKVVNRLIDRGYLDDYKFAAYYLENRNLKKGTSLKKLRLELVKKGISQATIDELLSQNIRDDREEIAKIIAKKRNKYDDEKLTQYLMRQGFNYDLIKESLG